MECKISDDRNTVTIDGVTTTFVPFKGKWKEETVCRRCWYYRKEDEDICNTIPCIAPERHDGRSGYFSIHEFPVEKKLSSLLRENNALDSKG